MATHACNMLYIESLNCRHAIHTCSHTYMHACIMIMIYKSETAHAENINRGLNIYTYYIYIAHTAVNCMHHQSITCNIYPDLSHCAWNKCMHVVRQMRANYILYQAMHYMMSTCTVFECYFAYVPCVRTYTIIQPYMSANYRSNFLYIAKLTCNS